MNSILLVTLLAASTVLANKPCYTGHDGAVVYYDVCGKCGGKTTDAAECEGADKEEKKMPCYTGHDGAVVYFDKCGKCGGDGSTCTDADEPADDFTQRKPCYTSHDGSVVYFDVCGKCGGKAVMESECATEQRVPCYTGHDGTPVYFDKCGKCGGDGKECDGSTTLAPKAGGEGYHW